MKKLFIVLAVASLGFVACNNDSDTPAVNQDSLAKLKADSIAKAAQDSTNMANMAMEQAAKAKALADSLHADSVKKKLIK